MNVYFWKINYASEIHCTTVIGICYLISLVTIPYTGPMYILNHKILNIANYLLIQFVGLLLVSALKGSLFDGGVLTYACLDSHRKVRRILDST